MMLGKEKHTPLMGYCANSSTRDVTTNKIWLL